LQTAMKHLRSLGGRAGRLENATLPLCTYQPHEFPARIRQRALNIFEARDIADRGQENTPLLDFGKLGWRGCRAIEDDIEALFMACLIDIGRMSELPGPGSEYADFLYPEAGKPLANKLGAQDAMILRRTSFTNQRAVVHPSPSTSGARRGADLSGAREQGRFWQFIFGD
jgi:hypothetical protein